MNEEKILEAIEKVLKKKYSIVLSDDAKEILSSIKAELPPTDLVKVFSGETNDIHLVQKIKTDEMYWNSLIPSDVKNIEVYIREVKQ